jgi:flagellar assembly protein FliH
MRSLPKIVKKPGENQNVRSFDFFAGFRIDEPDTPDEPEEELAEAEEEEEISLLSETEREILDQARKQADKILGDAREQAEILRERSFTEGREAGLREGFEAAHREQREILDEEIRGLQQNIREVIESVSIEKTKMLEKYIDDLKRISLAVAEKIVQTSLQSSGDIVKRMILSATDKITRKQWAKIYLTKCEAGVSMEVDAEFLEALSGLSDNIKIITMHNGEAGTCIIELPDEIIDASVSTQLENIKDILNNVRA